MGRKERLRGSVLTCLCTAASLTCGCSYHETVIEAEIKVRFYCEGLQSRAIDPEEEKVSDISLMIFDETGAAEECLWLEGGNMECSAKLLRGKKYIFCACANFGYQVYADSIEELGEINCHLAYPDEYRQGIPMYARQEMTIGETGEITVMLERMMAKISIQMDRRRLSDDVEMFVRSVRIGNCPRKASVFKKNRISGEDDCFPAGFTRSGAETDNLNTVSESGRSRPVTLYMLENMQGDMPGRIDSDSDKVFDREDYRRSVCSYIEMELEYTSEDYNSGGRGLVYRFYLGDGRNSLDVERNSHYHITVTPENDGLSDNGWRIDKTDLQYCGPTSFNFYPSSYIVGNIGDRIHIGCAFFPENAPFDVGMDYMEEDKARGIYDYVIDKDGRGATLTLKAPGTGLIYMEAGPPVNDAALFYIEVNLPK